MNDQIDLSGKTAVTGEPARESGDGPFLEKVAVAQGQESTWEEKCESSPEETRRDIPGLGINIVFDRFARSVTGWAGSPAAFGLAFLVVVVWAATGPIFHYSETWQLVINTGTTIITFLMVFVIQQSQNKDSVALHLKLNELLASQKGASNSLVDIEKLDEGQLEKVTKFYADLAKRTDESQGTP